VEIPVIARHNLDAFVPDTEIVVKIPAGTAGNIVHELRDGIGIVQFNVPNLGKLRVNLKDLEIQDQFNLVIEQMAAIQGKEISDRIASHKEIDKILIRALRLLADKETSDKVEQLIREYQKAMRWLDSRKNKDTIIDNSD
jgi:hypothetical protein